MDHRLMIKEMYLKFTECGLNSNEDSHRTDFKDILQETEVLINSDYPLYQEFDPSYFQVLITLQLACKMFFKLSSDRFSDKK